MAAGEGTRSDQGGGWLVVFLFILVVGAIIAAVISLAALVDPFNWTPRVDEVWADWQGDCALGDRFPGFWWHAAVNLAYTAVTVTVAGRFVAAVVQLRKRRVARYDTLEAAAALRPPTASASAQPSCWGSWRCCRSPS